MGLRSWFANSEAAEKQSPSKKGLMIKVMNHTDSNASDSPTSSSCNNPTATSNNDNAINPKSPPRSRINSRDIPRTYSGLYSEDDFKPLEIHRQHIFSQSVPFFLVSYLTLIVAGQLFTDELVPTDYSWTVTHAIHLVVTLIHVHWLKGSISDTQGELNAMTVWEQLVARGAEAEAARKVLLIVPTVLCYAGCHNGNYKPVVCVANLIVWVIAMLAKSFFMNGVRIFGINTTPGIDDDEDENADEKTDETPDVAGLEWKKQN